MSDIERVPSRTITSRQGSGPTLGERLQAGRTGRALAAIEYGTVVRMANVQSEGYVEAEKLREVDRLAHTAMSGHALLRKWSEQLAAGDPFAADDLKFFSDIAKLGKGEIIADAINRFRYK